MSLTDESCSKHELDATEDAYLVVNKEGWHGMVGVDNNHACKDDKQTEFVMKGLVFLFADVRKHNVCAEVLIQETRE